MLYERDQGLLALVVGCAFNAHRLISIDGEPSTQPRLSVFCLTVSQSRAGVTSLTWLTVGRVNASRMLARSSGESPANTARSAN